MKARHVMIQVREVKPTETMLVWEEVQRWQKEGPGWEGWTEARVDHENFDCIRQEEDGYRAIEIGMEVFPEVLRFMLIEKAWKEVKFGEQESRGIGVRYRSAWFKEGDGEVLEVLEMAVKALESLKGDGLRQVLEVKNGH